MGKTNAPVDPLYKALAAGGSRRNEAYIQLYKETFPGFLHFTVRHGSTKEVAKDLFQDGLLKLIEQLGKQKEPILNVKGLLFQICKNLFLDFQRQQQQQLEKKSQLKIHLAQSGKTISEKEVKEKWLPLFRQIGDKCQQLLKSFYFDVRNLGTIAEAYGYSSPESARVSINRCIDKLREIVRKHGF